MAICISTWKESGSQCQYANQWSSVLAWDNTLQIGSDTLIESFVKNKGAPFCRVLCPSHMYLVFIKCDMYTLLGSGSIGSISLTKKSQKDTVPWVGSSLCLYQDDKVKHWRTFWSTLRMPIWLSQLWFTLQLCRILINFKDQDRCRQRILLHSRTPYTAAPDQLHWLCDMCDDATNVKKVTVESVSVLTIRQLIMKLQAKNWPLGFELLRLVLALDTWTGTAARLVVTESSLEPVSFWGSYGKLQPLNMWTHWSIISILMYPVSSTHRKIRASLTTKFSGTPNQIQVQG